MITRVAIRFRGLTYSLPKPNRHHHIIKIISETLEIDYVDAKENDQGFLNEDGEYLTRQEALVDALANNQVKDPDDIRCGMLFSEDLW